MQRPQGKAPPDLSADQKPTCHRPLQPGRMETQRGEAGQTAPLAAATGAAAAQTVPCKHDMCCCWGPLAMEAHVAG